MRPAYLTDRKFYHAVAVLVGTMVGVGMYGIPFVFAKAGYFIGLAWLGGVWVLMALFNLLFAELVLSTQGVHQIVGYVNIWLGSWGRRAASFLQVFSIYGALLAYIIVVGNFLHDVLSHFIAVDPALYSITFAIVVSFVWFLRLRSIAALELAMIALYGLAVVVIVLMGADSMRAGNFLVRIPDFWYLPYGVLLFAFAGMSAVPLQRQLLTGRERLMRPAILWALGFTAVMYVLFATVVVGVSGEVTSPAAFAGLFEFLGTPVVVIGSLLGMMTITTAYIILGTALFETFVLDFRLRAPTAWVLTGLPPLLLFLSGFTNFIDLIGLIGAVAVGMIAVLVMLAYLRARRMRLRTPEFRIRIPAFVIILVMALFIAGVVIEFMHR